MATNKIKIIYAEKDGKPTSYQFLERSESKRAIRLIETLKQIKGWMPLSRVSESIGESRHSTTRTVNKLIGAKKILPQRYQAIILIKNSKRNPNKNLNKPAFYKSTTYICAHKGQP